MQDDTEKDPDWQLAKVGCRGNSSSENSGVDYGSEEDSSVEADMRPGPAEGKALARQTNLIADEEMIDRPRLSTYKGIVASQIQWMAKKMEGADLARSSQSCTDARALGRPREGHEKPGLPAGKKETAVPLPFQPSEALAKKNSQNSTRLPDEDGDGDGDGDYENGSPLPKSLKRRDESAIITPVPLPSVVRETILLSQETDSQRVSSASPDVALSPSMIYGSSWRRRSTAATSAAVPHFLQTKEGKPYDVWIDERGKSWSAKGALIPDGYKLHDNPNSPFICPVRNCRRLLPRLSSLVKHFGPAHRYATFNDNLDGTLSMLSAYRNAVGRSPPIIVSQNALHKDAVPSVEPRLPDTATHALAQPNVSSSSKNKQAMEVESEEADLEMEDWEKAPGRFIARDSLQNVAYSGAFLACATPIAMSPDIWFNVLTIHPGETLHVSEQRGKMQMYSVASGKVKVTTGGEDVQLGRNGAFPLRPGEKCVIENRLYSDAILHCTTVKDYDLVSEAES